MKRLRKFPVGSCSDTSYLLGKYLSDIGVGDFDFVSGSMDEESHAWLQKKKLIVDIPADQFVDQNEKIIVTEHSDWHKKFKGVVKHKADITKYYKQDINEFLISYEEIKKHL